MGSLYTSQYIAWGCPELSGRSYRVLLRMALVVMDEDSGPDDPNEGLYYGGWKSLTAVLGYGIWDQEEDLPPRVERALSRATQELRDRGYIGLAPKRLQRGHWNRVYRLHLPDLSRPRFTR